MRVAYDTTLEDWNAALDQYIDTWPQFRDWLFAWRWGVAGGIGALIFLMTKGTALFGRAAFAFGVGALLYATYPRTLRLVYRERARRRMFSPSAQTYLVGPRTIEVTTEGMLTTSPAGETLTKWEFIKTVDEGPAHLFVRAVAGIGTPIPRRCLTDADCAALLGQLRAKIAAP